MRVADTTAEAMLNTTVDADVILSLHTADPGVTGASEATGVGRSTIAAADGWSTYSTAGGARIKTNAAVEEFSASATAAETITHFTLWELDGTTVILSNAVTNSQLTAIGNPVRFPAGSFTFGMKTTI